MLRVLFTSVAVLGSLMLSAQAHAHNAVCTDRSELSSDDSMNLADAMDLAADSDAAASPAQPGPDDSDVPWCKNANDPRCSPLPGDGSHGQWPNAIRTFGAFGADAQVMRAQVIAVIPRSADVGTPRDGNCPRLERPPRARLDSYARTLRSSYAS